MCGIVVMASATTAGHPDRMSAALGKMQRRGPDGHGVQWRWDGRLGLGHRRLAIFETGPSGHQPMVHPDSHHTIVFNGSLYNYPELRDDLRALGHRFRTDSDTEVILAAWQEWGEHAFERFNGTWALALHDARTGHLILSRDRLGVRPLYAWRDPDRFLAASTVEALIALIGQRPALNAELVFDYLSLGLLDHEGRTLYDDIIEIPPGACWSLSPDGTLQRRQYHQWPVADPSLQLQDVADRVPDLLLDATRLRLRSHVPIAAQLSGGLDSGTAAWAIGAQAAASPSSFTGFFSYGYTPDGAAFDERQQALLTRNHVAAHLPYHEVCSDPTPTRADLDTLLMAQEFPVKTPSSVAGLRLYRAMKEAGVTVAITGDGSDELFSGYTRRYLPVLARDALLAGQIRTVQALLRTPSLKPADLLARLVWSLPQPAVTRLLLGRTHLSALTPDLRTLGTERLRTLTAQQRLPLDALGPRDVQSLLLPEILRLGDRNAMWFGIEARSPFLDYRVASLALQTPMSLKVTPAGGKQPLRRAMADRLPPAVANGPKVRGLGHAEQFQIGHLDLTDILQDPPAAARPYLDTGRLALALRKEPGNMKLWWPVCLLLWLRQLETA